MLNYSFKKTLQVFGIFLPLLTPSLLCGDIVTLTNGKQFEGVILSETPERIRIETMQGIFTIARDKITSIEEEHVGDNHLRSLEASLQISDLTGARKAHELALEEGQELGKIEAVWMPYFENLIRTLPQSVLVQRAEAVRMMADILKNENVSHEFRFQSSRLLTALGSYDEAVLQLDQVPASFLENSEEQWSGIAIQFLPKLAMELQKQGAYTRALEIIERLRFVDPREARSHSALAHLAESAQARRAEDFEKTLQILRESLYPQMPEIARNRTRHSVRTLVIWAEDHREERRARELIDQYVRSMMPTLANDTRTELFENELKRHLSEGEYEKVVEVAKEIAPSQMNRALSRYNAEAAFQLAYEAADRENPLELFDLAMQAHDDQLYNQAIDILINVRENPILKDPAMRQLDLIKEERDLDVMARALAAFDRGDLLGTIEICNEISEDKNRMSPQYDEVVELAELARKEIILQQEARPYQAEALFQEAERSYFLQEYDQSYELIDTILEDFQDTPAAQRASNLLTELQQNIELELLEGQRSSLPDALAEDPENNQNLDALDREIRQLLVQYQDL